MTLPPSRRGRFAFAIAAATLVACAYVTIVVFANPTSVSSGLLGTEWQCQRMVWMTTCTHLPDAPAARNWRKEMTGLRPT